MDEITEMQIKLSYLEDRTETLDGVVAGQQAAIDALERKVLLLEERLEAAGEDRPQRKPPHY